jgi:D-arabinose 1-dehydrogenase-like Zn-dependent alcohol dehydrogenase
MLVKVDACGICPTDLKKIEKGLLAGPRIFGHEIAGTVAALGPETGPSARATAWSSTTTCRAATASTARASSTRSARSTSRT